MTRPFCFRLPCVHALWGSVCVLGVDTEHRPPRIPRHAIPWRAQSCPAWPQSSPTGRPAEWFASLRPTGHECPPRIPHGYPAMVHRPWFTGRAAFVGESCDPFITRSLLHPPCKTPCLQDTGPGWLGAGPCRPSDAALSCIGPVLIPDGLPMSRHRATSLAMRACGGGPCWWQWSSLSGCLMASHSHSHSHSHRGFMARARSHWQSS